MPEISQAVARASCRAGSPDPADPAGGRYSRRSQETPPYNALSLLSRGAVALLNGLIWVYQRTFSPAFAVAFPSCGCRFAPSCSHYAQDALREHGVFVGLALTLRRLARCGPWHPGGFDPVPPSHLWRAGPRRQHSCTKVKSPAPMEQALLTAHR